MGLKKTKGNMYPWVTHTHSHLGGECPHRCVYCYVGVGLAPRPEERMCAMVNLPTRKFVTIEPVLDFDLDVLADWLIKISPGFVNLGADSKGHNLIEPDIKKIMGLVNRLKGHGVELRIKENLRRLLPKDFLN